MNMDFKIQAPLEPAGDQPQAIAKLAEGVEQGLRTQVLLGATGTGKTYTIAQVINKVRKPTLVIAHNKTLAAQLASELTFVCLSFFSIYSEVQFVITYNSRFCRIIFHNSFFNRIILTSSDFHNTESQFFAATVQIHSRKVPVSVPLRSTAASQFY